MPWVDVCDAGELDDEDAIGFDHAGSSYAICRAEDGEVFCVDGLCPKDGAHLAGGLVEGWFIECPMDDHRFDLRRLTGYIVRQTAGRIEADLPS